MNKTGLVDALKEETGLAKKDCEAVLNAFFSIVEKELVKGEKVQIVGFGTFEVKERAERMGKNPATKQDVVIPASKSPAFKAGKALKDAVNK